jgi:hypothetical protein
MAPTFMPECGLAIEEPQCRDDHCGDHDHPNGVVADRRIQNDGHAVHADGRQGEVAPSAEEEHRRRDGEGEADREEQKGILLRMTSHHRPNE